MTIMTSRCRDTKDKDEARAAAIDVWCRNKDAVKRFPAFNSKAHLRKVRIADDAVVAFTNFRKITTGRVNFYENPRPEVAGEINGPATALKYMFASLRRSFTPADARKLEAHLKSCLPGMKINVTSNSIKPLCIVHIGL